MVVETDDRKMTNLPRRILAARAAALAVQPQRQRPRWLKRQQQGTGNGSSTDRRRRLFAETRKKALQSLGVISSTRWRSRRAVTLPIRRR
ncbi:hypothetical protein D8L93_09110 [Sodalis-like symbiont of Bactericera trigonica]|nr:hypothetical protein D8L93_09110 [Sodalis-like symbiont of Bactericera trigonica]